ncbi:MFS transporter [Micromonospora sp. KC606]|uniref:MFS transporter n=1 Tax=Micromonospora sp. KC606 TaxID=2530379 RepID=UPI0014043D7B|nr:MFS transporter [Micromonospora sp. KC606]
MVGFGFSLLGGQIWFVALGWAASRFDDPLRASAVLAVATLPRTILVLFGGAVADRYGVLRVVVMSQTLRTVVMAGLAAGVLAAGENGWLLLVAALLVGVLDAAHLPAASALPPRLVAPGDLPARLGTVQTLERAMGVVGAPCGGFIVALGGLSLAAAVNAVLFAVAVLVLRSLRARMAVAAASAPGADGPPDGVFRLLRRGLRYAAAEPVVGPTLVVVAVLNLTLAGPLNVGLAMLAAHRGWGPPGLGWLVAGFAAGAAGGALALSVCRPAAVGAAGVLSVGAGSLCTALLPRFSSLPAAVVVAVLLGVCSGSASALLIGLVQARTRPEYQGRMMALAAFSALGLAPVAYLLFGALAVAVGLAGAFVVCGAAEAVTVAVALTLRSVRGARLDGGGAPGCGGR